MTKPTGVWGDLGVLFHCDNQPYRVCTKFHFWLYFCTLHSNLLQWLVEFPTVQHPANSYPEAGWTIPMNISCAGMGSVPLKNSWNNQKVWLGGRHQDCLSILGVGIGLGGRGGGSYDTPNSWHSPCLYNFTPHLSWAVGGGGPGGCEACSQQTLLDLQVTAAYTEISLYFWNCANESSRWT